MRTFYSLFLSSALLLSLLVTSCTDQLNINPEGVLTDDLLLGKPEHIDDFVTPCYSLIPYLPWSEAHAWWMHGSIRSDDTYRGGSGVSDQSAWHDMEVFSSVTANVGNNDGPWFKGYVVISRYNLALYALSKITDENYPLKGVHTGEVKFLRGATYFFMKTLWRYIPWVDGGNGRTVEDVTNISNRPSDADDTYLWEHIVADLEEAVRLLPEKQEEIGRINKNAARAMATKALLFMAYKQDARHQVIEVDKKILERALVYINEITDQEGESVGLCEDFTENFLPEYGNATKEAIWEIRYSTNDGTSSGGNTNNGAELNAPS